MFFRAEYTSSGVHHVEGGWPKDINMNDPEATQRYRRKIEKDDAYIHAVMHLGHVSGIYKIRQFCFLFLIHSLKFYFCLTEYGAQYTSEQCSRYVRNLLHRTAYNSTS